MKVLFFDLDNTLLECGQYYLDAQNEFVERMHERTGLDKELIFNILSGIDVTCSSLPDGFSKHRFPRSFRAASLALDAIAGLTPDTEIADKMFYVGNSVFSAPYPLYPGVPELLSTLGDSGWKLVAVTKGDDDVQRRKVRINCLEPFFPHKDVWPVLRKTEQLFRDLIQIYDADPATSWMIGDSLKDDIGPAKAAGLNTIHIRSVTGNWGYEDEVHRPTHTVFNVTDILQIEAIRNYGTRSAASRGYETTPSLATNPHGRDFQKERVSSENGPHVPCG